jgi:murein DD-endopeptidase MepM/ murein hydrolase activator NlpD
LNRTPLRLFVAALCSAIGAVAISLGRPVRERPAASVLDAGSRASVAPRWFTRVDTVNRNEQVVAVLERAGISREEASRALLSASALDARKIPAGTKIVTRTSADSGASEIVFHLAIDRLVRLRRSESSGWVETEEVLPWTTDTVVVGGEVNSSLTDALVRGAEAFPAGARIAVANLLADILEYRVDFSRDLQKGDSIRVLVERKVAPNGAVQAGGILAARITVAGRRVETVRFADADRKPRYLDGEGKTMQAAFLKAPLQYRRISSVFGRRKHPILGIWRAHQGIDYAAGAGTPVRAVGDGTVIYAGWKGGYGRVVEIRHRNGYVSRYGHLSKFGAGIRRGAGVGISNTIGFVGASGLATAPHLHFEVLVNGVHRDPGKALKTNESGQALAAADRAAFANLKAVLFARLDSPVNGTPIIAQSSSESGARGETARFAGDEE